MNRFDRTLARLAEPGVVLRLAALVVCAMELVSAGAALLGARTEPYDGLVAWVWRQLGGDASDRGLLLVCVALLLSFVALTWQLARQGSGAMSVNRRLGPSSSPRWPRCCCRRAWRWASAPRRCC